MRKLISTTLIWFSVLLLPQASSATGLIVGTGSTAGVYYQAGRALCRILSLHNEGTDCQAMPTDGSLFNLENVNGGALDLGIVQSDWHYHAVHGSGPLQYADMRYENLRALFSLHGEPFTLVARQDSGVSSLDDLPGKRVNIGNPGSGHRATMEVVMAAKGWKKSDFMLAGELAAAEQSLALCHNRVQAMVYTVGHPNPSVSKAVGLCDAKVVPASGPVIDKLVADNPYYAYSIIPGGMYSGNPDPVQTFGVVATVMASADMADEDAYNIAKTLFENLDTFRRMHPAFGTLEPSEMISNGLSAELHPGARRYYQEAGLL